jgi:hypothetical protein
VSAHAFRWQDFRKDAPRSSERWAATDRGWCELLTHPDRREIKARGVGHTMVGNYLDYTGTGEPGQDGKLVHACAYIVRMGEVYGYSTLTLGSAWFKTPAQAGEWIEQTVSARVGDV